AFVEDACAFAQRIYGTHAPATHAEDVGVENVLGAATHVRGRDLLDERRDVNVGRTGARAGRVETEQAAVGFYLGVVRRERRVEVGKILLVLGVRQLRGKILDHVVLRLPQPVSLSTNYMARRQGRNAKIQRGRAR